MLRRQSLTTCVEDPERTAIARRSNSFSWSEEHGNPQQGRQWNIHTTFNHEGAAIRGGNDDDDDDDNDDDGIRDDGDVLNGLRKIEAIKKTWTSSGLAMAYLGVFLISFAVSLETQTLSSLTPFATSSFHEHSLISAVFVVQNVVNAVIKPPMAKVADVFGRLEAFSISIAIYIIGYIQMANSQNIQTYASAQIFYSTGQTGLQILQQIFIADSSNLLNRAVLSKIPDLPYLATVWLGPLLAATILRSGPENWRMGYGMWSIILPIAFFPLACALYFNQRKAKTLNILPERPWRNRSFSESFCVTWYQLDLFGLLLLSGGVIFLLIPLTVANTIENGWHSTTVITMLMLGIACIAAFVYWESQPQLSPYPLISLNLLTQKTTSAGCCLAFFYFMAFYFSVQPYFFSYLQVVHGLPVAAAGRIAQTFGFASTCSAVCTSFAIRRTRRYRQFVTMGCTIYAFGILLMLATHRHGTAVVMICAVQVLVGLGGGMATIPLQVGMQAAAGPQRVAAATALFLTVLELGGAVGSAISGSVWTDRLPANLALYLPDDVKPQSHEIYGSLAKALSYSIGTPARDGIIKSYEETMAILLKCALAVCLPLVPLSFLMANQELDQTNTKNAERTGGGEGENEPLISRQLSPPSITRPQV